MLSANWTSSKPYYYKLFLDLYKKDQFGNEELNLYDIISQCVKDAQGILEDHGLYIAEFHCQDKVIYWKREVIDRIKQVIEHGITNSIEHGYVRPSRLGKEKVPIEITVSAIPQGQDVVITVSDKGAGIDFKALEEKHGTDSQKILFEAGISTAHDVSLHSGRGVGLTAIQEVTKELDGHVELRLGQKGLGTDLIVKFPRSNMMTEQSRKAS